MPQLRESASNAAKGGAKATVQGKKAFRTEIHFDNNRLLADLLGEFDAHLSMLEDKLGVEAVAHGNVVVIKGPENSCLLARDVLRDLYARLK